MSTCLQRSHGLWAVADIVIRIMVITSFIMTCWTSTWWSRQDCRWDRGRGRRVGDQDRITRRSHLKRHKQGDNVASKTKCCMCFVVAFFSMHLRSCTDTVSTRACWPRNNHLEACTCRGRRQMGGSNRAEPRVAIGNDKSLPFICDSNWKARDP